MSARPARGGTLVLGGGFAGATVARTLGRSGATIVSPGPDLVFTPLLPQVASGEARLANISTPLRVVCPHAELVVGTSTKLDVERGVVAVETPEDGELELAYAQLVVAVGAVSRLAPVPGLEQQALLAKTADDFVRLRAHVLEQVAAAAAEPAGRPSRLTFVFVGGGYAGVETLGELQRLAEEAARGHPALRDSAQRWVLVDEAPRILGDIPGRLGDYMVRALERRGVEIRTGVTVEQVAAGEVVLSDGERLATHTLVWTAGVTPAPVVEHLGLPLDEGRRVRVTESLQVEGHTNIWSAGDCAAVPNAATPGRLDPPTSQHAQQQGQRLARNLVAAGEGRPPTPYRYTSLGQVATLGRYQGTADVLGVPLTGFAGWVAARSVHAMQLPDPLARLAVTSDWALSMLFRRDTTR